MRNPSIKGHNIRKSRTTVKFLQPLKTEPTAGDQECKPTSLWRRFYILVITTITWKCVGAISLFKEVQGRHTQL